MKVRIGLISNECGNDLEKARRRKLCVWVEDRLLPVCNYVNLKDTLSVSGQDRAGRREIRE